MHVNNDESINVNNDESGAPSCTHRAGREGVFVYLGEMRRQMRGQLSPA